MVREVTVSLLCDLCITKGERVEGEELSAIALPEVPGNKPRVLALCDVHRKELYDPLVRVLTECGQTVDAVGGVPTRRPKPANDSSPKVRRMESATCPECGFVARAPQGLGAHRARKHGVVGQKTPAARAAAAARD